MNASTRDLKIQFQRVVANGWLPIFQSQAKRGGVTTARLLGFGSRETNLKNIRGDFRNGVWNGFGILQVDRGTDLHYAQNWTPTNVETGIIRGVDIYLTKIQDIKSCKGKKVTIKSHGQVFSFIGTDFDQQDLERMAASSYNCGRWAYYHFSKGHNVDSSSTGKDYSRDVFDRSIEFANFLEQGGFESGVIKAEIAAQGKYCREGVRQRFNIDTDARLKTPLVESMAPQEIVKQADYGRNDQDPPEDAENLNAGNDQETSDDSSPMVTTPANTGVSTSPGNTADPAETKNQSLVDKASTDYSYLNSSMSKFGVQIDDYKTSVWNYVLMGGKAVVASWFLYKGEIAAALILIILIVLVWEFARLRLWHAKSGVPCSLIEAITEKIKRETPNAVT